MFVHDVGQTSNSWTKLRNFDLSVQASGQFGSNAYLLCSLACPGLVKNMVLLCCSACRVWGSAHFISSKVDSYKCQSPIRPCSSVRCFRNKRPSINPDVTWNPRAPFFNVDCMTPNGSGTFSEINAQSQKAKRRESKPSTLKLGYGVSTTI